MDDAQKIVGLAFIKSCSLLEAWHEYTYDDDRYVLMAHIDGVFCRVKIDEVVNDESHDYDLYIAGRHDLGMDVTVYVYEDMLKQVRDLLSDIESHLTSAQNMDAHLHRKVLTAEQAARGKRGMLEWAEQKGYSAMQAIDAIKLEGLETLLGVVHGRQLFYAASDVRTRTYRALDGSLEIDGVRLFILELATLVEFPKLPPTPPKHPRYAVYNDNLYGHVIDEYGINKVTEDCIDGRFDNYSAATAHAFALSKTTTDKIIVYDCQTREILVEMREVQDDLPRFAVYPSHGDPHQMLREEFLFESDAAAPVLEFIRIPPMKYDDTVLCVFDRAIRVSFVNPLESAFLRAYKPSTEMQVSPIVESRANEVMRLVNLMEGLPDNSVLRQFFTSDMLNMLTNAILNGTPLDLKSEMLEWRDTSNEWQMLYEKSQVELASVKAERDNIGTEYEAFRSSYARSRDNWKVTFDNQHKSIRELQDKNRELQQEVTGLRSSYSTLRESEYVLRGEIDDWKQRYEASQFQLIEEKRRHDDTRQAMARLQATYEDSEASNIKLFNQRHKLAKAVVRRHPRVVTLLR